MANYSKQVNNLFESAIGEFLDLVGNGKVDQLYIYDLTNEDSDIIFIDEDGYYHIGTIINYVWDAKKGVGEFVVNFLNRNIEFVEVSINCNEQINESSLIRILDIVLNSDIQQYCYVAKK